MPAYDHASACAQGPSTRSQSGWSAPRPSNNGARTIHMGDIVRAALTAHLMFFGLSRLPKVANLSAGNAENLIKTVIGTRP
jgi:hypothetical protein